MAQVNLGRIGFVNKGSWNSVTNYKLNDVVKYGGSTYAAKRPNTGVTPPTNGTDTDDWFYFVNNSDYVDKTSNQNIPGIKNFTNGITTSEITTSKINGNPIINDEMTFNVSPIVPTPTTKYQVATKKYVDDKTIINNFTDKLTPDDTDNFALQEAGGDLKKVSYENLTKLNPNDSRVKTALNASGGAPIYACRAWVNFNGTGTVAIRASGNVSSITDNGTGDYTVNFTTVMPDDKYSIQVGSQGSITGPGGANAPFVNTEGLNTSSSARIKTAFINVGLADWTQCNVSIFR